MVYLIRPFQWLYCMYALIVFVLVMLLIFPLVIGTTFFGHIRGGNMAYRLCMFWADCWFFLAGIRHQNIYEEKMEKNQHFIFVANHISYLDAAIIVKAVRQPVRPLGKSEMTKVPVFGFIYRNAIVTVDRSSTANRARSVRLLKSVLRKGISIFFFPEGTFNMTDQPLKNFYDGAFRLAIETQTAIKPILFLDSYDRMHYRNLFTLNPGKNRVVHLAAIPVAGYSLKNTEELKLKVFAIMENKLRQYNVNWITPEFQL
jgi:1-acyl-sn-glycerol-3-phosphate acyltransferase